MRSATATTITVPAAVAATCLLAILIPRLLPWLFVLGGLGAAIYLVVSNGNALRAIAGSPVFMALAALSAYLFLNSTWALNGTAALEKSALFALLVMLAAALTAFVTALDKVISSRTARWAVIAILAGLIFLAEEFMFDLPVLAFLAQIFPQIGASMAKHLGQGPANDIVVDPLLLNRNMIVVALFLVPALLACDALGERWRMAARIALLIAAGICAFYTDSGTANVAIVAALIVLVLGQVSVKAVRWAVVALWTIGVVFAIPLGALPSKIGAMDWSFLPKTSAQARFYIWEYTAEKAKERPLTGIGVRSTRELQPEVTAEQANSNAYRYRPRPGRHAHNAFLQIWLELGAIGAALVLLVGLAGLRAISRLPEHEALYGYALFVNICAVASLGYGIWQTWLLGGFASASLLYLLIVRSARGSGQALSSDLPSSARARPGT